MAIFEKQKRRTFKELAKREIRKAILNGKLKPGDRIIEQEISDALGFSRFPVREALNSLEKAQLLTLIPFKGTYVAEVNEKDVEEIYVLRANLEQFAVRLLIENNSAVKIRALEVVITEMENLKENDNTTLFLEDMRFHKTICELCNNGKLLEFWELLAEQLLLLVATHEHYYLKPKKLAYAHNVIVEAIRNNDVDLAVKSIGDHIMEALYKVRLAMTDR